jgi:hypothetical protein
LIGQLNLFEVASQVLTQHIVSQAIFGDDIQANRFLVLLFVLHRHTFNHILMRGGDRLHFFGKHHLVLYPKHVFVPFKHGQIAIARQ